MKQRDAHRFGQPLTFAAQWPEMWGWVGFCPDPVKHDRKQAEKGQGRNGLLAHDAEPTILHYLRE